ncbi:MAG: acyl-CoA dehydrogenase [candidate division Zixibacteria bacterium]|nr:acyl-CoA dehydrogenase [candidate division Zixibacteria bacterium]NIX56514.1 acyl-CoA dehydrogenase [candidate division Zixibacteria bacterium]
MKNSGIDHEMLEMTIGAIREYTTGQLPDEKLLDLDHRDEFPIEVVREMCGEGLGIHLLFIPEEFEGMGGGAFDVYRVCEEMARIDLGVATGVLATFLGSDPIIFGGTYEQKQKWMTRIAQQGLLMAYGATEPDAGSDLGALRTTAKPVMEDGKVVGYKLNGNKQWISNGGYADLYTVLANAPGGPTWFVVEKGTDGFSYGKPEDKHGIRASNTASLSLDDVYVDAENLVGEAEGQGLFQAQLVFGYTRLMVAAFGLGGGWAALDRAIPYSMERIQGGSPLSEKQGYTHKLIIPHVARLEASRAFIEETAEMIDSTDDNFNTEGAIAKYLATEAGNLAADASIQALGGYGYTREYMVEKIKRDVRITTIYEGTSEIMEMTICRDRWQLHLKTRGQYYHDLARKMENLHTKHSDVGANIAALCFHSLAELLELSRQQRLTRNQHILFRLGELIADAEGAGSLAKRAARAAEGKLNPKANKRFIPVALAALSRIFAREAAQKVVQEGMRWACGADGVDETETANVEQALHITAIHRAQGGLINDMNYVADVLYERTE